jgi:CheY-like chemotaxis protein
LRAIAQSAFEATSEGRKRNHALVIDDSAMVARLAAQILSDNGYRVSTAQSMEQALADVDIAHVDLILSDIFMPGMGGLEGIKRIKAVWPKVRVVAMSAGLSERVSSERATSAAVRAGADAEIQKPFTPQALMNIIIDVMAYS